MGAPDGGHLEAQVGSTPPAKIRPGYANFANENPPLKLVLFEGAGANGSINHLGVEIDTAAEVVDAEARRTASGLTTTGVDDTLCCYAEKTETWLHAPDSSKWDWYVKKADSEQRDVVVLAGPNAGTCCPADPDCG